METWCHVKWFHMFKQTCNWKMQLCLSMCNLLMDTWHERIHQNTATSGLWQFHPCFVSFFFSRSSKRKLVLIDNSHKCRSSRPEVSCKKSCPYFAKFTGKHLRQSLFFNKVAGLRPVTLLKKDWHRCFPLNSPRILRTPFLQNTSGRLLL